MTEFELTKWDEKYVDHVARYANNEKIARNLRNAFPFPYTPDDARSYVGSCIENSGERQLCRAIVADGHTAGSVGVFLGSDVYEKCGELGYCLAEPYWGKGIMTEAVRRICGDAFKKFDLLRIYAEPFAHNTGSRRVLEKAGFQLEGVMKNGVFKNGTVFDFCMYARIREASDCGV